MRASGHSAHRHGGGDVHDRAPLGHARERGLRDEVHGGQIGVEHPVPLLEAQVLDHRVAHDAGVVDQDVDPAKPLARLVHEGLGRIGLRDVGLGEVAVPLDLLQLAAQPLHVVGLAVVARGDGGSALREPQHDRAADAARAARDDRPLPAESQVHGRFLSVGCGSSVSAHPRRSQPPGSETVLHDVLGGAGALEARAERRHELVVLLRAIPARRRLQVLPLAL